MNNRNNKGQFIDGENAGKAYRFTSERMKGNQHAKGNAPNRTSFTPAHSMANHACWKGGLQHTPDGWYRLIAPKKRTPNARYVWEQVHGELPQKPAYVVIHLDGDKYNDDINNLLAITRAEHMARNKHKNL